MKKVVVLLIVFLASMQLYAQDFWNLSNGPYGGIINKICEAPNGDMLLATENGLYYSTNQGDSWRIRSFEGEQVRSVTVADSGKIYAAIGGDLQLSKDNCQTWESISQGLDGADFKIIHPGNNGKLYCIAHISHSYNKFYEANGDYGFWTEIGTLIDLILSFDINTHSGNLYFGTFNDGIYRSTDNGFTVVKAGLDTTTIRAIMIDSTGNVYAGSDKGLYLSDDDGENWNSLGLSDYNIYSVYKNSNGHIFCGTLYNGIMRTTDGGSNWEQCNTGLLCKLANSIYIDTNDKIYLGLSGDGVFSSTDNGGNWSYSSDGIEVSNVRDMVSLATGRIIAVTGGSGIWYSDDKGLEWSRTNNGVDNHQLLEIETNSTGDVFACSSTSSIFKSTDNGASWTKIKNGSSSVGDFFIDNNDNLYLGMPNDALYKSTDNGDEWINIGLDGEVHRSIYAMSDTIIVGTYNKGIFRSTNNGTDWTNPSTMASTVYTINRNSDGLLYSGGSNGEFEKSTNGGESWTLAKSFSYKINDILFVDEDKIFVAFESMFPSVSAGMSVSIDNGVSWEPLNSGLKSYVVYSLCSDNDGDIFAGLQEGVYTNSELIVNLDTPQLLSPQDDATGVILTPMFSWSEVVDASDYQFQLSDTDDFSNLLDNSTASNTERMADYTFEYNTVYYWRVRAKQNMSVSDWTEARSFTTTIESPTLVLPEHNSLDVQSPVYFSWEPVDGAASYSLFISEESDCSSTFIFEDVITDTTITISGLDSYSDYYWRLQALGTGATSEWSEIRKFSTALSPPQLTLPEHNSSGLENIVICEWGIAAYSTSYIIELATEPDFVLSSVVFSGTSDEDNSHTFTLDYGEKYYWHVKSKNYDSESSWSEAWSFSTGFEGPVIVSPENNQDNLPIPLTLQWEEYDNAHEYYLEISSDSNFANILYFDSNVSTNTLKIDDLNYNTSYYWRVRVLIDESYSFWSEIRSFKTGIAPPTLISPDDKKDNLTAPFILQWNYTEEAQSYYVEISMDDSFENIILTDSNCIEKQYSTNQLEFFESYFWRVKAKVNDNYSLWSETWSFSTVIGIPTLVSPLDKSENQLISVEVSWEPVIGAEFYEIQFCEDDKFVNLYSTQDSIFDVSTMVENLAYESNYCWRVRAKNHKGNGDWSEVFSFGTKEEPNSVEELVRELNFSCFPSPAIDKVNFNLSVSGRSHVALKIYDLQGNMLYNKDSGYLNQCNHKIIWNSGNQVVGVYTYQLFIDNEIISGKIIKTK